MLKSQTAVVGELLFALPYEVDGKPVGSGTEHENSEHKQRSYKGNRPLAESRINRSGLSKNTPAPRFKLPLVTGGEVTLEQYLGRRVLLVFTDPRCSPCRQLLPELERLHKSTPDIELLIISRGNLDMVRSEIAPGSLSFPVAVQKNWEVSRRYAMFVTPIGYLIDEQGILISDVAIGGKAILLLLAGAQIVVLLNAVPE